ncbi:MAG: carbohydrate ABC transporter permease [Clostridia bacterium]|nr:carbohydrate ABC transporter permease [Clostridia bacterium]
MKKKSLQSKSDTLVGIINAFILFSAMLICVYPMIYVLFASVSEPSQIIRNTDFIIKPLGFSMESYKSVLAYPMIGTGYKNTLIIMVIHMALSMLLTIAGGYFMSQKNLMWQKPITIIIVASMFFSGGIIPMYLTVRAIGITDTYLALVLPSAVNTFNLILMRTGFDGLPPSLHESAKIDGAGHMTVLFKICVPLIKPTLAVIALYYAVQIWNSWFYASIFIDNRKLYPLQLVLREILISNDTSSMTTAASMEDKEMISETIKYSSIIISTLPILCAYPFLQKYFVKGALVGAVKG